MRQLLMIAISIVLGVGVLLIVISAVRRIAPAVPYAIGGGIVGAFIGLVLGIGADTGGAIGAGLALLNGLRVESRKRGRTLLASSALPEPLAPAGSASSPSNQQRSPDLPQEPPAAADPSTTTNLSLAHDFSRVVTAAPALRGRILAARVGCDLLLDLADAQPGNVGAQEWAGVIRHRLPDLIERGLTLAGHLDGSERSAALESLVVTLEKVADEADERRAEAGRAARDSFDTMQRYFDERTRRDPFTSEPPRS